MSFSIATFNVKDFFDDVAPHAIGPVDAPAPGSPNAALSTRLYHGKLDTIARVVRRLDADIVAFEEIKAANVLDDLAARLGADRGGYGPAIAARADGRGIGCGLLSRFPVTDWREHAARSIPFPVMVQNDPPPFGTRVRLRRAILEASIALADGTTLTLMVLHLKSKLPEFLERHDGTEILPTDHRSFAESIARSAVSRMAEALFVRSLVDDALARAEAVQLAVAGDFNDTIESVTLRSIRGDAALASRAEMEARVAGTEVPAIARGVLHVCTPASTAHGTASVLFRGVAERIDHVLVSDALWARYRGARVLDEELREANAAIGDRGDEAQDSDHAPVRAEFA